MGAILFNQDVHLRLKRSDPLEVKVERPAHLDQEILDTGQSRGDRPNHGRYDGEPFDTELLLRRTVIMPSGVLVFLLPGISPSVRRPNGAPATPFAESQRVRRGLYESFGAAHVVVMASRNSDTAGVRDAESLPCLCL